MLRPGNSAAVTMFVEDRRKLKVSPRCLRYEVLKSEAVIFAGSLQGRPLMKVAASQVFEVGVAAGQISWRLSLSAKQTLRIILMKRKHEMTCQELNIFCVCIFLRFCEFYVLDKLAEDEDIYGYLISWLRVH